MVETFSPAVGGTGGTIAFPTNKIASRSCQEENACYYATINRHFFLQYLNGKEFLTIPEALGAVTTGIISLLTPDVKTRKLIDINRDVMEEPMKSLEVRTKFLAKLLNAMWNILLAA